MDVAVNPDVFAIVTPPSGNPFATPMNLDFHLYTGNFGIRVRGQKRK